MLNHTDKIDSRRKYKYIVLLNLSTCYAWKNIKKSYKNNKFKISASTWQEEFELSDGSYSMFKNVQEYFEYTLKKHEEKTVNPSININITEIENRITFKIKTGCYLELLTPETMKLLGSTKSKIRKDKNGKKVHSLEITEVD